MISCAAEITAIAPDTSQHECFRTACNGYSHEVGAVALKLQFLKRYLFVTVATVPKDFIYFFDLEEPLEFLFEYRLHCQPWGC